MDSGIAAIYLTVINFPYLYIYIYFIYFIFYKINKFIYYKNCQAAIASWKRYFGKECDVK